MKRKMYIKAVDGTALCGASLPSSTRQNEPSEWITCPVCEAKQREQGDRATKRFEPKAAARKKARASKARKRARTGTQRKKGIRSVKALSGGAFEMSRRRH